MNDWLVTGGGASGSWHIRGAQLGAVMGATVIPAARDVGGYRAAILVKRPSPGLVERLHRANVPIVWDVVDAYPQPAALSRNRDQCLVWLRTLVTDIKPAAIVAATGAMERDCRELFPSIPTLWLPHHHDPRLQARPARPGVRKVGYEGAEHYLGRWRQLLDYHCAQRGWRFYSAPRLEEPVDIMVALRDFDGYAPRAWKSGVKLANAAAAGVPLIFGEEAGCIELAPAGQHPIPSAFGPHSGQYLGDALDALEPHMVRMRVGAEYAAIAQQLTLQRLAGDYREWLCKLSF